MMNTPRTIHVASDYEGMSREAAEWVVRAIRRKKDALICLATGESPARVYALLCEQYRADPKLFAEVRFVKLDEWGGLAMTDPGSCEAYLQRAILRPMKIPRSRYFAWNSAPKDPAAECERVAGWLAENGPIDINILGIGKNGHLGLNEPAAALREEPHVEQLAESSFKHTMLSVREGTVSYGLTLGMGDILRSRSIVMLASGASKAQPVQRMLSGAVTSRFPASLLALHPQLHVFCDEAAAKRAQR